ncbi:MAG TPA: hypothetical protein VFP39_13595 [Gemmatimonadales bacterium]|nr:hypothetical protein [Gemmatimonadales bacterium]
MKTPLALPIVSLAFLLAACPRANEPPPVDITAVNYTYRAPRSVPPGPTRFRLVNAGTVPHEVQLFRFKLGISPDSARALLALEHFPDSLADSGGAVLIAAPGTTAPEEIYADLQQGQVYALVCQFRDSAAAPKHDRLGMFAALQVARAP